MDIVIEKKIIWEHLLLYVELEFIKWKRPQQKEKKLTITLLMQLILEMNLASIFLSDGKWPY